jgi:hypothetical protein
MLAYGHLANMHDWGIVAAVAATAIIDDSDGKIDTEAKYDVANTIIGGIIGI